jgi:hypothetical protein
MPFKIRNPLGNHSLFADTVNRGGILDRFGFNPLSAKSAQDGL